MARMDKVWDHWQNEPDMLGWKGGDGRWTMLLGDYDLSLSANVEDAYQEGDSSFDIEAELVHKTYPDDRFYKIWKDSGLVSGDEIDSFAKRVLREAKQAIAKEKKRATSGRHIVATLIRTGNRELAEAYVVDRAINRLVEARRPSGEPYQRALDRIQTLIDRGVDVERHTLMRLNKTNNLDKIEGIYQAAIHLGLDRVAQEAKKKFHTMTGQDPIEWK